MAEYSLIMTTFPNEESAEKCIEILLNEKAAACIQIFPIKSRYVWNGEILKDSEIIVYIKSIKEKHKEIEEIILKNHPYEIPEIIEIDIVNGDKKYLKWIRESLI